VTAIAAGAALSSCGSDAEQSWVSEADSSPSEGAQDSSVTAAQAVGEVARRLAPQLKGFSPLAKHEGKELGARLASYCNLEQSFWNVAVGRAASPLVDTKKNNTFLVLAGKFKSDEAAIETYPSLVNQDQQACYRSLVRELLVNQVGVRAATRPRIRLTRGSNSTTDALALAIRTEVHYPAEIYKGKRHPARDRFTEARLGLLRDGQMIYFLSNFRWDRPPSDPLELFENAIAIRGA
jgi:hypothetical protein